MLVNSLLYTRSNVFASNTLLQACSQSNAKFLEINLINFFLFSNSNRLLLYEGYKPCSSFLLLMST